MSNLTSTRIPWLPFIPSDWKIGKVKQCFSISKELSYKKNPTILSLARSSVKIRDISSNEGQLAADYSNYNSVKPGDLLLNPMDLYSGANCNVSNLEGVISPAYSNLRAKTQLEPKFYDFYFKTQYWTMAMFAHGKGVSYDNRWTLNTDTLLNYEIPVPSVNEQKKIVDFLNKQTSKIDRLISNQEKQIEGLKEYRQAIITKVVTKGLDPSAQMKDSGVEWIGKIPCTWQVKRIKDFLEKDDFGIKCGPFGSALTGKVISNGEYNIYGQWNVIGNDFSIRRNTIAKNDYLNLINYSVRPKDILVSMMGSIGRCALVPENIHPGIMDSHIIKIRLNLNEMNPYFFLYEYDKNNSTIISEFYNRAKKGFIMDGLNTSIIKNAIFVSPPIDIQKKVVDYLDSFCSKVDAVISFKESKIQKLQTYKKSLIYEYVTGKKRVSL